MPDGVFARAQPGERASPLVEPHRLQGFGLTDRGPESSKGRQTHTKEAGQHESQHHVGDIRVVVLGAGYAGMIVTNRFLGSLTGPERQRTSATVVNPRSELVERIRLHEHP